MIHKLRKQNLCRANQQKKFIEIFDNVIHILQIILYLCCQLQLIETVPQPTNSSLLSCMTSKSIKIPENYVSNLAITFRKLVVKMPELNNIKIMVTIKTNANDEKGQDDQDFFTNFYQISQARTIKNGLACFYGECVIINQKIKNFSMRIITDNGVQSSGHRKQLAKFFVGPEKISEISQRKMVFSSASDKIELIWQGRIVNYQCSRMQQPQQERSLEDFDDIQPNKQQQNLNQLFYRRIYSPAVKGEMRRKKQQNKLKRDDSRSELVSSQSPHKLTMDTNQTLQKIKRRVILATPMNKNQNNILKQFKRSPKIKIQKDQDKKQFGRGQISHHPVLSPMKDIQKTKILSNRPSLPSTPQHKAQKSEFLAPKGRVQKFYDKISLKSLLYTSMVGIIGGMTAAQL